MSEKFPSFERDDERRPDLPPGPEPDLESNDPYAVLGLERGATRREVKRAYFRLVREYPPETEPEAFKRLRGAYEKLRTADTKAETDLFLFRPPYPWEARKRRRHLDLEVHAEDALRLLEHYGDLGRTEFPEDFRPVKIYE
jgi:curved DNA-binding protein CbpA